MIIIKIIILNQFKTFITFIINTSTPFEKQFFKKQFLKKQFIDSTRKRIFILLIYDSIFKKIVIFQNLQNVFRMSIFLIHYNKRRILYINIDVFKR